MSATEKDLLHISKNSHSNNCNTNRETRRSQICKMVLLSKRNLHYNFILQEPQLTTSEFPKILRSDLIRKCDQN